MLVRIEVIKTVRSRPATSVLGERTNHTQPEFSQLFEVKRENVEFFGEGLLGGVHIYEGKNRLTFGKGQVKSVEVLS